MPGQEGADAGGAVTHKAGRRRYRPGRQRRVAYRLDEVELELVKSAAAKVDLTVSGFAAEATVRSAQATCEGHSDQSAAGVAGAIVPDQEALRRSVVAMMAATTELNKIGVNLNQIAMRFNATGERPGQLEGVLDGLFGKIDVLEADIGAVARAIRKGG